jgi:hypothetical protein
MENDKQVIITIGREYGSGGHLIADMLGEKYGLPVYDSTIIETIAEEKGLDLSKLKHFDEKPRNRLFTRSIDGYSNSPEDVTAYMEFDFLREKAKAGESFIVVGRCGSSILKGYKGVMSFFVTADMPEKIQRVATEFHVSNEDAEVMIQKNNKSRKLYHNFYCKEKWGDSRYYELTINTSKIGYEKAAEVIDFYIQKRLMS